MSRRKELRAATSFRWQNARDVRLEVKLAKTQFFRGAVGVYAIVAERRQVHQVE